MSSFNAIAPSPSPSDSECDAASVPEEISLADQQYYALMDALQMMGLTAISAEKLATKFSDQGLATLDPLVKLSPARLEELTRSLTFIEAGLLEAHIEEQRVKAARVAQQSNPRRFLLAATAGLSSTSSAGGGAAATATATATAPARRPLHENAGYPSSFATFSRRTHFFDRDGVAHQLTAPPEDRVAQWVRFCHLRQAFGLESVNVTVRQVSSDVDLAAIQAAMQNDDVYRLWVANGAAL